MNQQDEGLAIIVEAFPLGCAVRVVDCLHHDGMRGVVVGEFSLGRVDYRTIHSDDGPVFSEPIECLLPQ